jgi:uncharacterized protein YdaL
VTGEATAGRRERGEPRRGRWIPLAVVAAIAAVLLVPAREQLVAEGTPEVTPLTFTSLPAPPRIAQETRYPAEFSSHVRTLVLYDDSGKWGWLGELYATMAVNLAGHFGRAEAKPANRYEPRELEEFTAMIYLGTTYGAPLPTTLLDDVRRTRRPVIWVGDNILQLAQRTGSFAARYGWRPVLFDRSTVAAVRYKGTSLTRWSRETNGIMRTEVADPSKARVLAAAVRADGSTFPWAVRSRNLTYVAEVPFTYMSETDRVLVFADLLFDALAPATRERHRALVRLEDVNPRSDPADLRAAADYLHGRGIPFGFGLSPYYRDPQGREDEPHELLLRDAPELVEAIRYMQRRGGVLIGHGYTHQWDGGSNPYNGITGDDVEFYRVTESERGEVRELGPLPGDSSVAWSEHRMVAANKEIAAAGLEPPRIFEFPHYAASDRGYRAANRRFGVRWERSLYFAGLLGDGPVDYSRVEGQFFPYVVHDVYGSKVLPENLGSITPSPWHSYKARGAADVVRAARANLVVRDGFASFYFHPFLDLDLLKQAVEGIEAAGYTFVDPATL